VLPPWRNRCKAQYISNIDSNGFQCELHNLVAGGNTGNAKVKFFLCFLLGGTDVRLNTFLTSTLMDFSVNCTTLSLYYWEYIVTRLSDYRRGLDWQLHLHLTTNNYSASVSEVWSYILKQWRSAVVARNILTYELIQCGGFSQLTVARGWPYRAETCRNSK
jgi:hypothetical protein